ncbi:MAG TPA: LLM class flavin-dependent oxidoreductase [Bryobacteraceae bacterium]|jgi:alkanesulfonate monooxygenase|nr:LLM class flavin-dependent oxidoreductase [Bryobacteraceae bacterium]
MNTAALESVDLFTTCPPYDGSDSAAYTRQVREVAQWSDEAGCRGILIYTDNRLLDPWLVAQLILRDTRSLSPLVAVQSVYMHPYSVAKMVSSLSYLYGRRIYLNMVAGGFKNDLAALNDQTPHDKRYERLIEYTTIIQRLLAGGPPVTFEGEFYRIEQLTLKPPLVKSLFPVVTISGSSAAGLSAAHSLGAIPVKYPEPPEKSVPAADCPDRNCGIRVGIIARETEEEAWEIADRRFPPDRLGQIAHNLAMKVSDSSWHRTLSDLDKSAQQARSVYWLWPFHNYKTFCPYLVGSYTQVADELSRYLATGFRLFIMDVPAEQEDLLHIGNVFTRALSQRTAKARG